MDGQMSTRFLQHILNFFNDPLNKVSEGSAPAQEGQEGQQGGTPWMPDVSALVAFLSAAGFAVKYSDKSDVWGASHGCRAIVMCQASGLRVVLDNDGPCSCPASEDGMKRLLAKFQGGTSTKSSAEDAVRAPGAACATVEESVESTESADSSNATNAVSAPTMAPPTVPSTVPTLSRQNTWSRADDGAALLPARPDVTSPESRRLSAPPAPTQSSWSSITGDDLNVMAATDLLHEALALLGGVKKVSLRNTPVGPVRGGARRASADTFAGAAPRRLSRNSMGSSSGLGSLGGSLVTSRSTSSISLHSNQSDTTPRPATRPVNASVRRTNSLRVGVTAAHGAAAKKTTGTGSTGSAAARFSSFLRTSTSESKSSSQRYGPITPKFRTSSSLLVSKQTKIPKSPGVQSSKL